MNTLDRFISGGWRKCSWETYTLKENAKGGGKDTHRGGPRVGFKRRVTLAFLGALLADIALSLIIWLSLMMGISLFDLESKWGVQIDAFKLLTRTFGILFVLLFLGFLVFVKPKNKN
jgi:hypothetical protein